MAKRWIEFAELKQAVHTRGGIREVLNRYGFLDRLKDKGKGKLIGPCPIHNSTDSNSIAFHVDCNRDLWHCFSQCTTDRGKAGGGILELVMLVDNLTLRQAGEKLAGWFDLAFERRPSNGRRPESDKSPTPTQGAETAVATHHARPDSIVNPPLERPLRTLDPNHPYLFERGLKVPTIETFGVGFCRRGLMAGRVAIPIRDERGQLVAYAGRAVEQEQAEKEGRYKLPTAFVKSAVLFNLHRAREHTARGLIVVEGFFDAMKVHQAGFLNVVALMGSSLSEQQGRLLVNHADRLTLMFDGDEAGIQCLRDFYRRLRRSAFLKEVHLDASTQPDSLSDEAIRELLGS